MTGKRNITVAIEPALPHKARAVAARKGLSVSALLADKLHAEVCFDASSGDVYEQGRLDHLSKKDGANECRTST